MKKVLFLILLTTLYCFGMSQSTSQRSSGVVTVQDKRLDVPWNLYIPKYTDTTDANSNLGLDSCGAIIFTYVNNQYWYRGCSPKKWLRLIKDGETLSLQDTSVFLRKPLVTGGSTDSIVVVNNGVSGKVARGSFGVGGFNSNIGSGYRYAVPNTNNIKTSFAGYGILKDSSLNTNGITDKVDTATLAAYIRSTIPASSTPTFPQTLAAGRTFSGNDSALLGANSFYFKNGNLKSDTSIEGKSIIGGATSEVGNLFYDFFKDRTSIGYNYTTATPNATITLDGTKMVISGGVGNSNNYITRNYYIGGETWTQTVRGKVNTVNSTSYGIIMGMIGSNFSVYAIFGMDNSSGNLGKILLQTTLGSTFQTSSGAASVSAGDSIVLTMSRSHNVLTVTYQDVTSGTSSSTTYNFSYSSGTNSFPNTGTPRLYIYGGSQNINYWAVSNNCTKNIPVLGIGNSIMAGHFAGSVSSRYMNQIFSSDYSKFSIDAGPSDNIANVVSKLSEIASYGASYILVDIGTNNIGAGQTVSAFITEYTAMLLNLLSMNSKVILCAVTPRNAVDVTPYNTAIAAIASLYGLKYINIFTPLATGTNLNASYDAGDGLHINGAGNTVIATTISAAAPELLTAGTDYNLLVSNRRTAINNPTQFNDTVAFNNNVVISTPQNDNDSSNAPARTDFVKRNLSSSNYFINNNGTATQTANFKISGKGTALQFGSLPATNIPAVGGGASFINASIALQATANNDVLSGIIINPTFNNGAFSNVSNYALQILGGDVQFANDMYFNAIDASNSRQLTVRAHTFQSNYGSAGSLFKFNRGGTNILSINSTDNVGVKTTSPDSTLHIAGSLHTTAGVRMDNLPNAVGTKMVRYNLSTGVVSYADTTAAAGNTIYTGNGTLSGDRTIDAASHYLLLNNLTTASFNSSGAITLNAGTRVQAYGAIQNTVIESSAGTLTLDNALHYIFNGTTTTWTLPALGSNSGVSYYIKNAGSGNITLQRGGSDNIYNTSSVTSITILPGEAKIIVGGTSFWYVE